jgi:hypothetical protein
MHEDLRQLLRWSGDRALFDDLSPSLIDVVAARLGRFLERLRQSDSQRSETLKRRIRELPDSSLMRILTAPQTFYLATHLFKTHEDQSAQILSDALDAEACRLGDPPALAHPVWGILGDCYYPVNSDDGAEAQEQWSWRPDRTYRAPRLSIGMPVDAYSPNARGELPDVVGSDVDFLPPEVGDAVEKLSATVEAMGASCPEALDTVSRFSRALVIRKDAGPACNFFPSSTRMCIGRPVFRNPHLPGIRLSDLAEALVHESIHAIIDTMELRKSLLLAKDFQRPEMPSPWTGRVLDTNTYIQACFIWYGLWNFWLRAIPTDAFPYQDVLNRLQQASKGFAAQDVVEPLADRGVRDEVLEALRQAQSDVHSSLDLVQQAYRETVNEAFVHG